jgi:hypothetical protein
MVVFWHRIRRKTASPFGLTRAGGATLLVASMSRLMVVPGDLNWHIIGLLPAVRHGQPPWTMPPVPTVRFWDYARLKSQSHGFILHGVGAW